MSKVGTLRGRKKFINVIFPNEPTPSPWKEMASAYVPLIHMQQMWITSKLVDSKELPLTTANNNAEFVEPLELSLMLEFLNIIGHDIQIRLAGQFNTKNLPQPWQTLTEVYKLYVKGFKIVVLMSQSQPIESSQGTNRTLSARRLPNPQVQQSSESSATKKPIIIRIPKRKKPDHNTPISTSEQINVSNLDEATQINVTKLVDGEDFVADKFADKMMLSQEDLDTRIDPWSHKESPEAKKVDEYVSNDEEVEEETTAAALIRRKGKGAMKIRDTPLSTPTRSPRTESLSSDKEKLKELTGSKPPPSLSKPKYDLSRHLRGAITYMSR
ncbi:hypothetical protein Tco_0654878 [Tanacetum coccineum]|uniref:Uncharacterized protein n=1 Tax=Tanacetum coccineum TaxID=301880 RepID=A0ABQ4X4F4_9ASTR